MRDDKNGKIHVMGMGVAELVIVSIVGFAVGYNATHSISFALLCVAYALAASIIGGMLSLLPIGGPVILWLYALPWLKDALGLSLSVLIVVDVIVMIYAVVANIVFTLAIVAIFLGIKS